MIAKLRQQVGDELENLSDELARWVALGSDLMDLHLPVDEERVTYLQRRMGMLGSIVAGLAAIEPGMIPVSRAGFGSTLRVRDMTTGEDHTYTLMTGDLFDLDEGHVSLASPLGHALLGRTCGEEVSVVTPRGMRQYRILSLRTLHQILEGGPSDPLEAPALQGV